MSTVIASEGGRWLRGLLYLATTATGIWAILWPSATLVEYGSAHLATAFGLVLALAGTICLIGTVTDMWAGELIGLPMATTGTGGFSLLLCWTLTDSLGRGTIAGLAVMATLLLATRWRGVARVARVAREDAPRGRHPRGT